MSEVPLLDRPRRCVSHINLGKAASSPASSFFSFFITLKPRIECFKSLRAFNSSPLWVGDSVGNSDVFKRDRPRGVARDREIKGQRDAAHMLQACGTVPHAWSMCAASLLQVYRCRARRKHLKRVPRLLPANWLCE